MKRKIILFGFLILVLLFAFIFKGKHSLLDDVEDDYAYVNKYFVYGTHFNIEGFFDSDLDINNAYIALVCGDNEVLYDLEYEFNDSKLLFKTSSLINDGIYLDSIEQGKYFVFLKLDTSDGCKYYSLKNATDYGDILYYTITRNNKNNLINIGFDYKKKKDYLFLNVSLNHDKDYYDIVIDAGHGGDDPGANDGGYNEADITLDYALSLRDSLEDLGLKVKLTRDDDVYIDTYGNNSRTAIPYEVKAKYILSIHLNSCEDVPSGGVEIYAPNSADLGFAKSLAFNIKNMARTKFSTNESYRVDDGVYVRTFTIDEIDEAIDEAREGNYKPYMINTDTNYYFVIRETGGFMTNAYVDGRNKNYKKNSYYDSNIGAEGYLLELGYINHDGDLNNLLNNKMGYISGIVASIKEEFNL